LNKTLGVLASGAAKRPEGRCPGQEASVKKYGLAEVEAGKRAQRASVVNRAALTKKARCSAQDGNTALFPSSLESEQNRIRPTLTDTPIGVISILNPHDQTPAACETLL
jgi:hypothetical protein